MEKKKIKWKSMLIAAAVVLVSSFIRAVGIHTFIVPNNFAPGGVTGIATMVEYKTGLSSGYGIFALNLPLLILAWIFIGKKFTIKSGAATLLSSALLVLFQKINFFTYAPQNEKLLAAIAGGILGGAGLALMLKIGGSTGGTDIIATLIQRKFSATNLAWFIFGLDALVVFASFFVYQQGFDPVILALCNMFVSSKVCETISNGVKSAIKFEVVTERPDELSKAIIDKLGRGVTAINCVGKFTNIEKTLLICIVRKRQISAFRTILKDFEADSFAYITTTTEVVGRGFPSS